jgi:hypothetical protein
MLDRATGKPVTEEGLSLPWRICAPDFATMGGAK